ncbi:MAG: HlyD family efflux transporter periplasmic adaptor subunit [Acidobacteriota bacterium]|nr:HlyD family efflux transporter periplasmic adaptor subunit [Acidobacteriota bacterium]
MPSDTEVTQERQEQEQEQHEELELSRTDLGLDHEPVNEIIGKQPNWIIRWGITVVFISVLLMLVGTWIIKYPDVVVARISITTLNPPAGLVARTSGKLTRLFVADGEDVKQDQYLVLLENAADYDQIMRLRALMDQFQDFLIEPDQFLGNDLEKMVRLGDLQTAYADFFDRFDDYKAHIEQDFNGQKIGATRLQIERYELVAKQLENQRELLTRELEVAQETYKKNKDLFEKKLVPESQLSILETQVLERRISLSNADSALVNNNIRIGDLRRTLMELEQQDREDRRTLAQRAQTAYKKLENQYRNWEQLFVLKAPLDGKVSMFQFWSPNQYVNMGERVLTIIPEKDELVGRIFMPMTGSGKVVTGQKVHIKFSSYPYNEFGVVEGKVGTISQIAEKEQYLVNVDLPNGLMTTYGKELAFKFDMAGTADIITEDLRLIERIFSQLRYVFTSGGTG